MTWKFLSWLKFMKFMESIFAERKRKALGGGLLIENERDMGIKISSVKREGMRYIVVRRVEGRISSRIKFLLSSFSVLSEKRK